MAGETVSKTNQKEVDICTKKVGDAKVLESF